MIEVLARLDGGHGEEVRACASDRDVHARFRRRAHLPIIIASGILNAPVKMQ